MKNQFQTELESTLRGVVELTEGQPSLSLGAALHLKGISLEMLVENETWEFFLLAELNDHNSRLLQWWLEDYRNTGISIL